MGVVGAQPPRRAARAAHAVAIANTSAAAPGGRGGRRDAAQLGPAYALAFPFVVVVCIIRRPRASSKQYQYDLPKWLSEATAEHDAGKTVSDRFLKIEKTEQKLMQQALSGNVSYRDQQLSSPQRSSESNEQPSTVQIAGLEKGTKNRYKDILPFEHARVRLQELHGGSCDYVNASHLSASRSNKRYIATQGPLPATCEVSL